MILGTVFFVFVFIRLVLIKLYCTHKNGTIESNPAPPTHPAPSRVWLMALLTGVLVSVTELIKMHMFGIIHRLSLPGRGETTRQIYVNYQPVSLSLMGTRVTQENCFSLCIIKSHHKNKDERGGLTEYSEGVVSLKGKGKWFHGGFFSLFLTVWEIWSWLSTGAAALHGHLNLESHCAKTTH